MGGPLAAIASRAPGVQLIGLNIDHRQLELCFGIAPPSGGSLALVEADAVMLPFADAYFDHVVCVEAMFHFRSRRVFLTEAARGLRSGGTLTLSDILMRQPADAAPWDSEKIAAIIRRDYGPWPELWTWRVAQVA